MIEFDMGIVEKYLDEGVVNPGDHWIFDAIAEGKRSYEPVDETHRSGVQELCETLMRIPHGDLPVNRGLVRAIYGDLVADYDARVNIIVGSPDPYDAFVRERDGRSEVFLDLRRLLAYGLGRDKTISVMRNFITHELVHLANRARIGHSCRDGFGELLWMSFDEGMAHYLSFRDDILAVDFGSGEYAGHREASRRRFREALALPDVGQDILDEGCSGRFWEKFASIHGMFAIADLIGNDMSNARPIGELAEEWYRRLDSDRKSCLSLAPVPDWGR